MKKKTNNIFAQREDIYFNPINGQTFKYKGKHKLLKGAKIYDLQNTMKIENVKEDFIFLRDRTKEIESRVKNASDVWIEYDKKIYEDDEIFKALIEDIQNLKNI